MSADVTAVAAPVPAPRVLACPSPETRSWKAVRLPGDVEGYRTPEGVTYVRARADEAPALQLVFDTPGLPPLLLVRAEASGTVTRVARSLRRQQRELRRRGLA